VTFKGHSGDRNRATGLWFRKEEAIGAYSSLPDSAEHLLNSVTVVGGILQLFKRLTYLNL
jgi:hypothetical protein